MLSQRKYVLNLLSKKVGKLVGFGGHKTSCPLKIEDGNTIYGEDHLSIYIGNLLRD